ncbi:apolipoprotein N-acyltransferase [Sphingosinicella sp. BN140058]|uniref:apolipoprotein N-acyltransferase n=1 Tax=Sphingosinicella sp. BN140058 TaxID=1892855 RepID=UPI00101214AF|nr:apolipoprotein N-acyltransferase [Sphingosinicella sp. BN140058]QAY76772.1 apolipoprotein N-acyltransferase [Sphingosinicella sp. BN140058]
MKKNLVALVAGIVGACGFAPLGAWPLTLAAFALLLWLVADAPRMRSALTRGWWFGVGHFTLGLNWIATAFTYQAAMPAWLGWVAVVLLSLYLAVYPAMATGLAWRWGAARPDQPAGRSTLRLVLIFAAAWIVTEWLRATLFTGFAWNPLGVALLPTPASWTAQWIGTYGLSGFAALLAGALLILWRREWRPAAGLVGAVAVASGLAALASRPPEGAARVALRIVQPNIGQQDKWEEGFEDQNMARLEQMSAASPAEPRLLLWPEAAITRPLENELAYLPLQRETALLRREVGALLRPGDLLLTGGITWRSATGEELTSATNSVFAIGAGGRILARYDKAHLVPYGEYLPMRPILSAIGLSRLAPGDVDFDPGPGPRTLDLPLIGKAGFQLCYEIIFSGEVVDRANRPAFLFNPSNDAWFGAWGPPQHLAQARLRALEEGLPILRSTPTGISAVIDAEGRLLASLPWRERGVIDSRLPLPKPPTPFARLGNVLPLAFALLLAALGLLLSRRARTIAKRAETR